MSASCGSSPDPRARRPGQDLDQLAGDVAADDDLRVDDDMDAAALPGQLVGDRVDQEGHVVGDDLDDRVAAGPAVLLDGGRVHPDVRGALRAVLREPVVGERGAEDVDRVAVREVLGRGVQVVALEVREQGLLRPGPRRTGR